jgi:hypothetical protein
MPLTFTSAYPRRLVAAQARLNTTDNWATIPGVVALAWRPETLLAYDYANINTTGQLVLYKTTGAGRGFGRKVVGVLWLRDSEAFEALVAYSHLNSNVNATIAVNTNLQLQIKFNTGLNTDNYRYVTKLIQPVVFGTGYSAPDWITTLRGADKGLRGLFPLPWRCMFNSQNTHFNATANTAAGVFTSWSNS